MFKNAKKSSWPILHNYQTNYQITAVQYPYFNLIYHYHITITITITITNYKKLL